MDGIPAADYDSSKYDDVDDDGDYTSLVTIHRGEEDDEIGEGNGAIIEVFKDDRIITIINTYVGEVLSVEEATSRRDAYIELGTVGDDTSVYDNDAGTVLDAEYRYDTEAFDVGDIVTFHYSMSEEEVHDVQAAEIVTGNVESFTSNRRFSMDGTTYEYGAKKTNIYGSADIGTESTIYLDENGYVLYAEEGDGNVRNYALVLNAGTESALAGNNHQAYLLFTDGSTAVVDTDKAYYDDYENGVGTGTGIIATEDGYIITNSHVILDSKSVPVQVKTNDGTFHDAVVVGYDKTTDLAVLKIDGTGYTPAEFGNSDELVMGQAVLAIGNPGGTVLAGSTTGGMVSGLNRNINSGSPYSTSYIQVDAAINPGNSGGALVNEYGQVVGINSAKIAETDYEGIGFAIPINEALPIIQELMQYGHVTGRAALGIQGYMINEAVAAMRRMPVGFGIEAVDPSSDLASKNVVAGDIITYINDKQVTSYDVLANELAEFKPGDTVKLTIYRSSSSGGAGRSFEVNVVLIESAGE